MGPRVSWIEEKEAEEAGEPRVGVGEEQLRIGISEAAYRPGPLSCILKYRWAFHGLRW